MKRKKKQSLQEKRFYLIVPEKLTVPASNPRHRGRTVRMESGRLIAQGFHLGRLVEHARMLADPSRKYEEITTIVLSARNERELTKVFNDLSRASVEAPPEDRFEVFEFKDTNPPVYGTRRKVQTIVCTSAVPRSLVDGIIGHLERYSRD